MQKGSILNETNAVLRSAMNKGIEKLDAALQEHVVEHGFPPGAVIWIGHHGDTLFREAYGYAQVAPRRVKIKYSTVFDLASLTKPLVTAMSVMILHE